MATTVSSSSEGHNPLPDFVFPARASPSTSAPSSFSRATGSRRPVSVADLPSFSFNPSGTINAESGIASPPLSPHRSIPSRSGFHKRGTSEFIGGDGKNGSTLGLMSTSPTKGDGILPPPNSLSTGGPLSGRRGHQHRRSAAISAHDLSFILKPTDPNTILRGGSAPCSPSDEHAQLPFPGIEGLTSKETNLPTSENDSTVKPVNRARVGFSDDVQFIPRPLSLVSSESSGTTIRPGGHSVSGSLSSIVSGSSPPPKEKNRRAKSPDDRPKTAAARLDGSRTTLPTSERPSPRRQRSNPILTDIVPITTPTSPSTSRFPNKKWTFFGHEGSSPQSRPTSSGSSKEPQSQPTEPISPIDLNPTFPITSTEQSPSRRTSSGSRKTGKKKQKKVKSWAGSILSRKSRQRSQKQSRRSPTPPLRAYGSIDEEAKHVDFDEAMTAPQKPELATDFSSWVPRRVQTYDDDGSMSPIIDLDAALGPFNTPSLRDAEWDAATGGSPSTKRGKRMHSAAGMGNFGGPGMHYHRRAQSSPEFENPRFGIRHLNSSSTMADVFEEDEEDEEWEDAKASSDKESCNKTEDDEEAGLGIDIKVVDAEDMHPDKAMDWTVDNGTSSMRGVKRKGSGLSEGERRHLGTSMKSTHSSTSLQEEIIMEESSSPVEIVDDSRPDSRAQSSDSTATPPFRARPSKDLAPVDIQPFTLQPPYLTPTSPHSTTQSSLPSPRSPFSYDTQRISTAPSSVTDDGGFQSLLLGEPGPELRMSVDDVPSLSSTNSTMTRDSTGFPMAHNPQFRDGQRSASLSSAVVSRKRSSMASLSRLISSSHGEKSKLSIESRAPTLDLEKKEKSGKGKRLSRMMQFWKPKDSV